MEINKKSICMQNLQKGNISQKKKKRLKCVALCNLQGSSGRKIILNPTTQYDSNNIGMYDEAEPRVGAKKL